MTQVFAPPDVRPIPREGSSGLSRGKRLIFGVICGVLATLLVCGMGEIGLRMSGHRPWHIKKIAWTIEPGGTFFASHPRLGYTLIPGQFKVGWHPRFHYSTTHWAPAITGLDHPIRATHPMCTYNTPSTKPEIWILGCSWTYGQNLNDEETFSWILQQRLAEYEVLNFGVGGYGTLHGLIQLQGAMGKRSVPRVVVLAYADFHDERNTFLRTRRKVVAPYCRIGTQIQPYAGLARDGTLCYAMATATYTEFPLMRHSALIHQLEIWYDRMQERVSNSHQVSQAIVQEIADLCRRNGIQLVVAGIHGTPVTRDMLDYCRNRGIATTDISVDMTDDANTFAPYDHHPSARASRQFAEKLYAFLSCGILNTQTHKTLAQR